MVSRLTNYGNYYFPATYPQVAQFDALVEAQLQTFKGAHFDAVYSFRNKRTTLEEITDFQYALDRNRKEFLSEFNSLANNIAPVPLPVYNNDDAKWQRANELSLEYLFDKNKFLNAVAQVFEEEGKQTFSYDELWEMERYMRFQERYPNVIIEAIRTRNPGSIVDKEQQIKYLNNTWESYSIAQLYEFLKEHQTIQVRVTQEESIKKWCDVHVSSINIKQMIRDSAGSENEDSLNTVYLSFFVRRLKLKDYSQNYYLDILSTQKWDDHEVDIFDFVSEIVSFEKIKCRVIENLNEGILSFGVLENHLAFCLKHNLTQASNHLINYLTPSHGNNRYKVLESYAKLNGPIRPIAGILDQTADSFKYSLVEYLIQHEKNSVKPFLKNLFRKLDNSDEEKMQVAKYLILLGELKGLRYYYQYILVHKTVPFDSSPDNPLNQLTEIKSILIVLNLFKMGYDPTIRQNSIHELKYPAANALANIMLHKDQLNFSLFIVRCWVFLQRATIRMSKWRKTFPSSDHFLKDLAFYLENAKSRYYISKGEHLNLASSIKLHSRLKR